MTAVEELRDVIEHMKKQQARLITQNTRLLAERNKARVAAERAERNATAMTDGEALVDAALDILAISTGEARLRVIRRPADRRALRQWQGGPRSKFVVRVELSGFGEEPMWLDLDPAEALAFSRALGDKASEAHEEGAR